MNERIRKLAEQAGVQEDLVDNINGEVLTYIARPQDIKKLVELVVRECASIDFYKLANIGSEDDYNVTQVIKKHFGIQDT